MTNMNTNPNPNPNPNPNTNTNAAAYAIDSTDASLNKAIKPSKKRGCQSNLAQAFPPARRRQAASASIITSIAPDSAVDSVADLVTGPVDGDVGSSIVRVAPEYAISLERARAFDMNTLSREDLIDHAWSAGTTDGEGCITAVWQRFHASGRRATMRIRYSVTQNELTCLDRLQQILGCTGKIYRTKRQNDHNRQMYTLHLDGASAVAAVALLRPFLTRKKTEADVLLDAIEPCWLGHRPGPRGYPEHVWKARERLVKKLQRLK